MGGCTDTQINCSYLGMLNSDLSNCHLTSPRHAQRDNDQEAPSRFLHIHAPTSPMRILALRREIYNQKRAGCKQGELLITVMDEGDDLWSVYSINPSMFGAPSVFFPHCFKGFFLETEVMLTLYRLRDHAATVRSSCKP